MRRLIAGDQRDVPPGARRTNDGAWEQYKLHEAWALVPIVSGDRPVGVAHLEGINKSEGLTRWQYEVLTRLSRLIGAAVADWQHQERSNAALQPSVRLVDELYSVLNAKVGRELKFEKLIRQVFSSADGVTLITPPKSSPKPDLFFSVGTPPIRCTLEVKCAKEEKAIGEDCVRQVVAQMDALAAQVGLIALANKFSSHNAQSIAGSHRIVVLDLQRVQRLVALSAAERNRFLLHWINNARSGLEFAEFSGVEFCS
jgi:hypothetical protein